jgi:hypothetical protein
LDPIENLVPPSIVGISGRAPSLPFDRITSLIYRENMANNKKLMDNVDNCVNDMIEGLLYINDQLVKLNGFNVLLRKDIDEIKLQEVTLLSGMIDG